MKVVLILILITSVLFFVPKDTVAQLNPLSQNFLLDYHKNPFSYLYFHSLYLDEKEINSTEELQQFADSILLGSLEAYIRTQQIVVTTDNELDTLDILILSKKGGNALITYVLVDKANYYLVCKRYSDTPCDCGANLAIFIPGSQTLKNIEKPFSFSLKNNLIDALSKYANVHLPKDGFDKLCDVVTAIIELE